MNIVKKLFGKDTRKKRKKQYLDSLAERLVNVTYIDNEVWLVVNSMLVAPLSILVGKSDVNECMSIVSKIREIYVQRHL